MRFRDYISIPVLIAAFVFGFIYNYFLSNVKKQIYVYPTPETKGLYAFRDLAGNCFDLEMHESKCSKESKDIPPQRNHEEQSSNPKTKGFVMSALKYSH